MSNSIDLSPFAQAFEKAASVVCFVHPQATYDAVAAAVTAQQVFSQAGKSSSVVCSAPMRPEYQRLQGINQVSQELGNRDLVISFAYNEEQVDKVSYNVNEANQRFELIISPKNTARPLDPKTVEFSQSGLSADIIVLFGFHAFNELGEYYTKEKYVIDSAFTVAVTQAKVPAFAKLHVALQADQLSYSEWMFYLLRQLQVGDLKDQVATNILSGIEYATDRFQAVTNARTFETMAQLLRAGGKRQLDNPALAYLATPIQDNEIRYPEYPQPASPSEADAQWSQPNFVPQNGPRQLNTPMHLPANKNVAPSEFAQAMGNRS